MPAKPSPTYVGLDISKDQLDYWARPRKAAVPIPLKVALNSFRNLRTVPGVRVVCEASGGYERLIVAELLQAGIEVCVVQLGRVRAFAYAEQPLQGVMPLRVSNFGVIESGHCC